MTTVTTSPGDDEQEIVQRMLEQYRVNVAKYDDVIAMQQEGASLDDLHPEMDEEEAREYGVDLSQFAQRHGLCDIRRHL